MRAHLFAGGGRFGEGLISLRSGSIVGRPRAVLELNGQ